MSGPKLSNDEIKVGDLKDYLSTESDFSFELKVLKMLVEAGIECEHGGHYQDSVTGKSREFDIRAKKDINRNGIRMAIECKNIRPNFPILISTTPRKAEESFHQIAELSPGDSGFTGNPVHLNSRAKVINISGDYTIYRIDEAVGKSTAQVGRKPSNNGTKGELISNDAELYEKWGQSLSSANDLVNRAYFEGDNLDYVAIFSILVIPDNRLWVASYDLNGAQISNPEKVDRCSCFVDKNYEMGKAPFQKVDISISHMEVMTVTGLKEFIYESLDDDICMNSIFSEKGRDQAFEKEHDEM